MANKPQQCRFEATFMPCRSTTILSPMQKDEPEFKNYANCYKDIRVNLENNDYSDFDSFYQNNNISSDEDYCNILRAGIKRPRVFLKRQPYEKWHNNNDKQKELLLHVISNLLTPNRNPFQIFFTGPAGCGIYNR